MGRRWSTPPPLNNSVRDKIFYMPTPRGSSRRCRDACDEVTNCWMPPVGIASLPQLRISSTIGRTLAPSPSAWSTCIALGWRSGATVPATADPVLVPGSCLRRVSVWRTAPPGSDVESPCSSSMTTSRTPAATMLLPRAEVHAASTVRYRPATPKRRAGHQPLFCRRIRSLSGGRHAVGPPPHQPWCP